MRMVVVAVAPTVPCFRDPLEIACAVYTVYGLNPFTVLPILVKRAS